MSKKKDLELVYNLQWKTKPTNGDDKANIVGMYDIPATTLSWEAFKSYLLKNSGTAGDDVKVSYIYEDKEIAIESQLDFQIALYYFRKKARNGEIITLTLDRSHYEQKIMLANAFSSNDAQTQVNIEENSRKETDKSLLDGPPDWFQKYMTQFKQEVVQDVTASFMNALSRLPSHVVCSSHHSRKSKSDIKRNPKYCDAANEKKEKEILKSMKLERKLENKLEKLERKAIKVKERRLSLLHSHSKDSSQRKVQTSITADDSALRMNAYSPKSAFSSAYHMMGGEIYMQQWEVENNGELPWTSQTELRYAWGSQALNPVSKVVACPKLAPGEVGFINVFLEIPVTPGTYECYWHFYHNSRRFGQWLGCQIVVDPPVMPLFSLSKDRILKQEEFNIDDNIKTDAVKFCNKPDLIQSETKPINNLEELKSIGTAVENLAVNELADCSSDTDNHSIISIADSNTSESSVSLDEFVVLTRELSLSPSAVKDEEISDGVEIINRDTPNDDNNNNTNSANIEAAVEQEAALEQVAAVELEAAVKQEAAVEQELTQEEEGRNNETLGSDYAFVVLEGNKVAVPKAFLRADFLATAEDAPNPHAETLSAFVSQPEEPKVQNTPSVAETKPTYSENFGKTTNSFQLNSEIVPNSSHCSTAGSNLADSVTGPNDIDNRSRLFVFPQSCPGFEIVNSMVVPEPHAFAEATPCHHSDPVMPESFVSPSSQYIYPPNVSAPPMCGNTMETPLGRFDTYNPQEIRNDTASNTFAFIPAATSGIGNPFVTLQHSTMNTCPASPVYQSGASSYAASCSGESHKAEHMRTNGVTQTVTLIPETLVTGAVNVASSAINTARSVLNMIVPGKEEPGKWINGHWVTVNPNSNREVLLDFLDEMGFKNRDYNASLLNRYDDDIDKVIADLLAIRQ